MIDFPVTNTPRLTLCGLALLALAACDIDASNTVSYVETATGWEQLGPGAAQQPTTIIQPASDSAPEVLRALDAPALTPEGLDAQRARPVASLTGDEIGFLSVATSRAICNIPPEANISSTTPCNF